MKTVAHGFTILKRYSSYETACWVLHNNGEGAIVEMPPYRKNEKPPFDKAEIFFKKNKLFPKYGLISHPHFDHCYSLPFFKNRFPETKFVAHKSFFRDSYIQFILRNIQAPRGRNWIMKGPQIFDIVFDGDLWQGDIGGEPIYVIHAPKHSPGDLLIIFKGAIITGDWYIGDLNDCNDLVRSSEKIASINKVMGIVHNLDYHIHMIFSAHGNHLF
ncbi:MAG: MBL fold metallo-hydrolase, partial [Vulcanimicrobiota bacterium]